MIRTQTSLPPGQRGIATFPRFGTHMSRPAPAVPPNAAIVVSGAVRQPFHVPVAALATLPRREVRADFHCVAGWSATDLLWEGVPFESFFRHLIVPALEEHAVVTHLVFVGMDGYRSIVVVEDALGESVLIADRLGGRPLESDHGAPARLLSPSQYGYISTKHLCRIEVHTAEPEDPDSSKISARLLRSHPRARVWEEERHGSLPSWLVRPFYRALKAPLLYLSAHDRRR